MRARRYATFRTVAALILREMSTRYGKTPGGYVWAVLEPLGAILILAFGFSLLLRSPSLGTSFILFYASGFLPFNLYQQVSLVVARAINFSRALMFYPSVTWVDAILARFVLNTLTGMMVTYILIFAILGFTETRVVLDVVPIIAALVLAAFLGLGIGTLNCLLGGLFPTWDIIWSIVSRPLFLASGILFTYEDLPSSVQSVLYYNPLIHITGIMRSGLYPMYNPQYVSPVYVIAVSTVTLGIGVMLLARHHKTILNS
ncbi:MAG: ABC transporter permease [Rhodobacteraceae bacterium]|nr:ABC transporter permease [Paracoccaceae bacterium]